MGDNLRYMNTNVDIQYTEFKNNFLMQIYKKRKDLVEKKQTKFEYKYNKKEYLELLIDTNKVNFNYLVKEEFITKFKKLIEIENGKITIYDKNNIYPFQELENKVINC